MPRSRHSRGVFRVQPWMGEAEPLRGAALHPTALPQTTLTGSKPSCSHLGLGKQQVVPAPSLDLTPQPMAHCGAARFAFLTSPGPNGDHLGSGDCFKASIPIISLGAAPSYPAEHPSPHLPPCPEVPPPPSPSPSRKEPAVDCSLSANPNSLACFPFSPSFAL